MMKKSIFLYLKQGIKGVIKFKIQFIVIIILSFLASFILSVSLSSTKRISDDYHNTISKMNPFDYVSEKVVNVNSSDVSGTDIIAPMDIMNSQFIYSIDSEDPTSKNNKALDINYNLSFFSKSNLSGYNQKTFLTETFEDKTVQEKFLNMITDLDYWKDIFGYEYDPEKDLSTWEPYRSVNYWSDATSSKYLKKTAANYAGKIINFYIYTIEKLKENYLKDLFLKNESILNYIKNTLFYELKNKGFITEENFKMSIAKVEYDNKNQVISISDNGDNDIYNRYLYFSLEAYLRQIIRATTEYQAYWVNQAIITSKDSKERKDIIKSFNDLNENNKIGFNFIDRNSSELQSDLKNFGLTIFTWIFGFKPEIQGYDSVEINKEFIVTEQNTPWKNSVDISSKDNNYKYLKSKKEVYDKGMRGSLTQLIVNKNNKIINVDKTFNTNYLRHFENSSIDKDIGRWSNFDDLDYYDNHGYENISRIKGYFMKNELLAKVTNFDYKARAEVEYTDNVSEITYRIVDIENQWKNSITLYEGNLPRTSNEILINTQFARANKYKIGKNIKIGGNNFVISGFASEPLTYYPMANTTNPLPNSKKNAIIYANKNNLDKIITTDLDKSTTKTVYSFLTYKNKDNRENIQNDIDKFRAYSFTNIVEVYNSYEFLTGKSEFKENYIIERYKSFSSSNLKINWLIAPKIIYGFKIFSIIFCVLICLIAISAAIIAIKKTVELNAGEIGILNAMGAKSSEISLSYLSYGIIITLFVIPFAWIVGAFVQEFIAKVFIEFSGGRSNILVFSPIAIVISILCFGVILCLISFFTAFILVKRPTLEIINKLEKTKKIYWLNQVKNRSFSTRFSLELAVSGLSKTIISATTIFMAGFLVSFGLTIPGLVQNVFGSYYKNVLYSNYYENRDLIGNAPLAKTSLSPTKEVDEYEKNLIDSKSIFGSGISNISKNVTDFAPIPDASAIPQILLSQNSSKELTAKWVYDSITNSPSGQYNNLYQEQNSVISIIASLLGNNISQLVGKGISIADMQKILEWTIHSNSNEFKNSTNNEEGIQKRIKKINDLSELLTNGLPQLLTNFIKGSSISEGEWKEQIIEIIIFQTPAYIKQYLAKSENRFNNFSFGWQINKYIPGVDNLYTNLLVSSKNNLNLNITGLQKTQNAYKISEKISNKVFINEYQSKILEKVLNDKPQEQISTKELESIKDIYNKETQELTIPVVANDQTDFVLNNDWNNLSNPLINKSRLVLRNGLVNIPNQAWMYDDGDWIRYNKNSQKNTTDNGYIEMQSLSPSKFTYAPIFNQTGFNLINEQKNRENINLMDNSYGFYNLTSTPTEKGEELNLEIRPYYSFDNITMFIPNFYKSDFEILKEKGNVDSSQWWKEDITKVPQETKEAWEKINSNISNDGYFAIKPYSFYFDSSGNYKRELKNLSGTPTETIAKGYYNFYARTLRDNNGPITFGNADMNWISGKNVKSIKFKKVSSIDVYGSPLVIADQDIINILSGYGISKYIPFNLQYEDLTKPVENYTYNDVKVDTYSYINPMDYYSYNKNLTQKDLVYGNDNFERSIRPSMWYTGIFSNAGEPYFMTSQVSFTRDTKSGVDTINGDNYGASSLEIEGTKLLSQQKALINKLSVIILSIATIAIALLIIIMILTVTLINDLYVNQYRKFMIFMKFLGYSNWKIIKYTFATVTILSLLFYILGVATNFTIIAISFNIISHKLGSIPFGLTWWTPIFAILLVFGAFFSSIAITTRKIRKESPSVLMK